MVSQGHKSQCNLTRTEIIYTYRKTIQENLLKCQQQPWLLYSIFLFIITRSAVALHCCKAMQKSI